MQTQTETRPNLSDVPEEPQKNVPNVNELFGMFNDGRLSSEDFIKEKTLEKDEAIKAELDKIVSALVGTGIVTKIILFGSCARGENTTDSDIDLCVLTPLEEERCFDIMVELRVKLFRIREKKMALDLLAYNQDFFLACAEKPGFQRDILKNGVVLYE
ncbi:hypothetical protein R80B4_03191 [Fibrobacteres bacterium R8-0-B4]